MRTITDGTGGTPLEFAPFPTTITSGGVTYQVQTTPIAGARTAPRGGYFLVPEGLAESLIAQPGWAEVW